MRFMTFYFQTTMMTMTVMTSSEYLMDNKIQKINSVLSDFPESGSGLTPLILLDRKSMHGIYCIPGPATNINTLIENYYRIVYPLDEMCKVTGLNYKTVHSRFYRKEGILLDPTTHKRYCLVHSYYKSVADFRYYVLNQARYSIPWSEDQSLKNFFGYLTPTGLTRLFPWIDFTIPEAKLMYQPFLIPIIDSGSLHYILIGLPQDYFGMGLTDEDYRNIYQRAVTGKSLLTYLKDITPAYAHKIVCSSKVKIHVNIPGLGKICWVPVRFCMSYGEFLDVVLRYVKNNKPEINLRDTNTIFSVPFVRKLIIKPLRKNIDLRVSVIKESIQKQQGG